MPTKAILWSWWPRGWPCFSNFGDELRQKYRIDVLAEQVDLSDVATAIQLHQRLRERGISIDVMINNAGHELRGPFLDGPLDAALAMVQLDIASLTAVVQFLRKT